MPLHINLPPHETLIVNGCAIKNGDRQASLMIENRADILRGREIMTERDATTPVLRLQHSIQLALVSPSDRSELLSSIYTQLSAIESVFSGTCSIPLEGCKKALDAGDFYGAFRSLEIVAEREEFVLSLHEEKKSGDMM